MSLYICHSCKDSHTTENMVAYCSSCYKKELNKIEMDSHALKELSRAMNDAAEWEIEAIGLEADVNNQGKIIEAMEEVATMRAMRLSDAIAKIDSLRERK